MKRVLWSVSVALALLSAAGALPAQVNYHVLHNGGDVAYSGVGAGLFGTQTANDGLGVFIPGEDLRAATCNSLGDFGVRAPVFREHVTLTGGIPFSGAQTIDFPALYFVELDGANAHRPDVFTNPVDNNCSAFPLGSGSGYEPYGTAFGCTGSFLFLPPPLTILTTFANLSLPGLTPGIGFPGDPAAFTLGGPPPWVLVPDNQLTCGTGTATFVAAFGPITIPVPPGLENMSWVVQFDFVTDLELNDDIDGLWHYAQNSPNNDQYFVFSNDETNIWQSHTVGTAFNQTALNTFPANDAYCFTFSSRDPNTTASLSPVGFNLSGPYYTQTENVIGGCIAPGLNPNGGFDIGRGSQTLSFSRLSGDTNPNTGCASQDAGCMGILGTVPSLGFATWDNGGDGDGSKRLTWIAADYDAIFGVDPALGTDIVVAGGCVRLPVPGNGFLQPVTGALLNIFVHETKAATSGWPDPDRLPSGAFGVPAIAGASHQLPLPLLNPCIAGIPIVLAYGTSGLKGLPGGPCTGLTYNQTIAATSGSKQIFIFQ